MATVIRLKRFGTTNRPTFRIVVADSRKPLDGKVLEEIGHYNPRTEPSEIVVNEEAARKWLAVGAQPSNTVRVLFKNVGLYKTAE
ncbi:30S ribosomal protein S16 [bacterium]|nr:30S ribosomal protein S16 [bacterium]